MAKKTVLMTGCGSGIGLATAVRMRKAGWRVLAGVRRAADADRIEREFGLEPLVMELSEPGSIAAGVDAALERTGGRIEALFNNAAYGQIGAVEDVTVEALRRQFETNLFAAHDLARRLIPVMRASGHGRIVQCSSVLGLVSGPYRGAYSASKFALEALSDAMRLELSGSGIHVSLIEPGPIRTKFLETALDTFQRTIDAENSAHRENYRQRLADLRAGGNQSYKLEPDAVAAKVQHALESARPKARYFVTTPTYAADALRRVLPTRLLDAIMARQ